VVSASFRDFLYRPIVVGGVILSLALIGLMAAFVLLSWRNLERLYRIEATVTQVNRLQEAVHGLHTQLLEQPDAAEIERIRHDLDVLAKGALRKPLAPLLETLVQPKREEIETAIRQLQELLTRENDREQLLLRKVVHDAEFELEAASGGMALLLVLLVTGGGLTRRGFLLPLRRMNDLLVRLAEGRRDPIDASNSPPPWRTLLENYNSLVRRLVELEQAHRERAQLLESQVKQAVSALLAQNRDLAKAERLAAVGEVAAGLAHELRNPLAGIRMALHNLRAECSDREVKTRLDLIIAELERLCRHLNQLLDQARHRPEPLKEIRLASLVGETLELLRYQIPETIRLHVSVPETLTVCLPETGLRRALINLVLNAVQAIGEREGNIWVMAWCEGERLLIEVADDGPGFPEALLSHGIRPFASGRDGGTGLGLLMVKRFVASLDGRLRLGRRAPRGAKVTLEIPYGGGGERGSR